MKLSRKLHVKKLNSHKHVKPILFIGVFGLIGATILVLTFAATSNYSIEPETSTVSGNASVLADATASGGSAIKFTQAVSNGPCAVSTPNVPDGPDPWGGCFPGPSNTGVPAGTTLTAYTGSCTITSDITIDAKTVNCPGGIAIRAKVIITRSNVIGRLVIDTDVNQNWSLSLTDSKVSAEAGDLPAIFNGNLTILRANISGGHNAMECQEHSSVCQMRDTYIHDQWQAPSGDTHLGGVAHFGEQVACLGTGSNGMTAVCMNVEHSSIICDAPINASGGGCTGDLNMIAHYGPITGAYIYRNLMGANKDAAFCSYGGYAPENGGTRIVYVDNIFQRGVTGKCAAYGAINAFQFKNTGNLWTNNKYDDGTQIICTAADECF